jgi:restriction endonuclease S subunit
MRIREFDFSCEWFHRSSTFTIFFFDHDFQANINQAVSILRFDEDKIQRIYLIVFFNSLIGKLFVEKYARQGLQTNLNLQEVSTLEIPILPTKTQSAISSKVQESFRLKKESERLLELAKRAVEVAIEKGEKKAFAFLERESKI